MEVSKSSTYKFTLSEDAKFVAVYRGKYSRINLTTNEYSGGIISGSGKYIPGTTITINAEPNFGWRFLYWKEGENKLSENKSLTFVVDYDRDIKAVFEAFKFNINVTVTPQKAGSVYGNGLYSYSSTAYLSASSTSMKWVFKGWKSGKKFLSNHSSYSFTVNNDVNLKAVFRKDYDVKAYGIHQPKTGRAINTRFSIDICPSFFLRPVLFYVNTIGNPTGYYEAFNKVNYGGTLNIGWRPIETRKFLFGFLAGATGGSGIYNSTVSNSNGGSVVSKAYSYCFSFGGEIGGGGRRCKVLFKYLNSIESNHFNITYTPTQSYYTPEPVISINNGVFEVRRESIQLGILVPMGKLRMTNMDLHFNLGHELQWDWNHPSWNYTSAAYPGFDYGGGLYFYFKWFCFGADVNTNVQNLSNLNVSNIYLNSKIGFNFSRLYTY